MALRLDASPGPPAPARGRLNEGRVYFAAVVLLSLAVAGLVLGALVNLSSNFLIIACDTAAFHNAIVNTLAGHWFRDTAYDGPNLLGLHGVFVLLLIAPIYAVFPSVKTLIVLQVVLVYLALIPLYLLALDFLGRPVLAFLVALAALTAPFLFQMALGLFHPEAWILAAALWTLYFYRKGKPFGFWLSLLLGLSCGEQAGLIYVALGASLFFVEDGLPWRRRFGAQAAGAGLLWLLVCLGILFPLMHHAAQRNLFAYNYSDWVSAEATPATEAALGPQSAADLGHALTYDPILAVLSLVRLDRWGHLFALLGVPLLLALLHRRSLILLAPFPLYFLMNDQEFLIPLHAYYYQFAFLAAYLGLILFLQRWNLSTRRGIAVLAAVYAVNGLLLCWWAANCATTAGNADARLNLATRWQFSHLPAEAGVYGPHRFSAYLASHANMVLADLPGEKSSFEAEVNSRYATTNVRPEQIDYIVSDLQNDQCGWRQFGQPVDAIKARAAAVQRLLGSKQWETFWARDDVIILKRVGR